MLKLIEQESKAHSSGWTHDKWPHRPLFAWQLGFGAFSASKSLVHEVVEYIHDRERHHKKMTFQEELIALLKKHEIDYDPRCIWDSCTPASATKKNRARWDPAAEIYAARFAGSQLFGFFTHSLRCGLMLLPLAPRAFLKPTRIQKYWWRMSVLKAKSEPVCPCRCRNGMSRLHRDPTTFWRPSGHSNSGFALLASAVFYRLDNAQHSRSFKKAEI